MGLGFGIPNFGVPNAGVPNAGIPAAGPAKPLFGGFSLAGLPFANIFSNSWIWIILLVIILLPSLRTFGTFFNNNIIWIIVALLIILPIFRR